MALIVGPLARSGFLAGHMKAEYVLILRNPGYEPLWQKCLKGAFLIAS